MAASFLLVCTPLCSGPHPLDSSLALPLLVEIKPYIKELLKNSITHKMIIDLHMLHPSVKDWI
jgi:hypothetical protein